MFPFKAPPHAAPLYNPPPSIPDMTAKVGKRVVILIMNEKFFFKSLSGRFFPVLKTSSHIPSQVNHGYLPDLPHQEQEQAQGRGYEHDLEPAQPARWLTRLRKSEVLKQAAIRGGASIWEGSYQSRLCSKQPGWSGDKTKLVTCSENSTNFWFQATQFGSQFSWEPLPRVGGRGQQGRYWQLFLQ